MPTVAELAKALQDLKKTVSDLERKMLVIVALGGAVWLLIGGVALTFVASRISSSSSYQLAKGLADAATERKQLVSQIDSLKYQLNTVKDDVSRLKSSIPRPEESTATAEPSSEDEKSE